MCSPWGISFAEIRSQKSLLKLYEGSMMKNIGFQIGETWTRILDQPMNNCETMDKLPNVSLHISFLIYKMGK